MPTRNLGKTGFKVGIFSLGGQSVLERAHTEDASIPLIDRALDLGELGQGGHRPVAIAAGAEGFA